ncbi:MAG: hypothetical protein O7C67_00545 [Gammaproteobacteria bacterium]|nr:hypothetical protein [Gammaproteobacteria bacterium]
MHRTVAVVVGLPALSGIATAAMHYVGTSRDTGFLDYPVVKANNRETSTTTRSAWRWCRIDS